MPEVTISHTFREMTAEMRPQDPGMDGAGFPRVVRTA
jgi:hypothetical protein